MNKIFKNKRTLVFIIASYLSTRGTQVFNVKIKKLYLIMHIRIMQIITITIFVRGVARVALSHSLWNLVKHYNFENKYT